MTIELEAKTACCPLCGAAAARELYRFEPARWIPGSVKCCAGCNVIYKVPSESAKPIPEYYTSSEYHDLEYWSFEQAALAASSKILEAVLRVTGTKATLSLLDVGCGTGDFLELAKGAGYRVSGLDLNPENVEQARKRTGGAEVICGDFTDASFAERFDVVTMLDVIEHVTDPMATIRQCRQLLKPGGHLVVYTPNHRGITARTADMMYRISGGSVAGPVIEIFDCLHLVFFDVSTLKNALQRSNLEVVRTLTFPYNPARNNQATGIHAIGVRWLEALGSVAFGQFRILMFARNS